MAYSHERRGSGTRKVCRGVHGQTKETTPAVTLAPRTEASQKTMQKKAQRKVEGKMKEMGLSQVSYTTIGW